MFAFQLFSEWRNRRIYGETLADAVRRCRKLQRPDQASDTRPITYLPGEWVEVAQVLQDRNTTGHSRGSKEFESVIFEATDGSIHEVDVVREPV